MSLRPGQKVIWHMTIRDKRTMARRAVVVEQAGKRVCIRTRNGVRHLVRPDRVTPQ